MTEYLIDVVGVRWDNVDLYRMPTRLVLECAWEERERARVFVGVIGCVMKRTKLGWGIDVVR